MTFDWHMLYPLHTVILDNSHVFGGVLCKAQLCNFSKWFFRPRFGVVPIWELWQFCYVRIGPPKTQGAPPRAQDPTPQRQHGAHHTRNNQGHTYTQHRRDASLMHSREPSPSRPHREGKATQT